MAVRFSFLIALCAGLSVGLLTANIAQAQNAQPRFLQAYGDWDTYSYKENGDKVCYMASIPKKSEGKYSRRGEVYAYITHRPGENTKNVFSFIAGYDYKTGSDVTVTFGKDKVTLFTQGDKSWASDEDSDNRLATFVQKKNSMVVHGKSTRGTKTKDTFSLRGSGKAYQRITKECGL